MRNRKAPSIAKIIVGTFLGIFALPFIISLGPLFAPIIIFVVIGRLVSSANQRNNYSNTQQSYPRQTNSYKNKVRLSNQDKNAIDKKLTEFFKTNYKLPICADLAIVTKNGSYTCFEDLYISKNGESIISLSEYGDAYPTTYNELISLVKAFCRQSNTVLKAEVKPNEIKESEKLSDAEKYIERINMLNNSIPQEQISNGLRQTCELLRQIDVGAKQSSVDSKVDRLYDYYLPILTDILNRYKGLLAVSSESQEFKDCEASLIKTIILINEALKTINESMHEDDYMNLSADITTLQSLLRQDGLVKEGSIYHGGESDNDQ